MAIFNLSVACSAIRDERENPESLTDEDLARQLEEAAIRVVGKHPELALRAARQLDFDLVPRDRNVGGTE